VNGAQIRLGQLFDRESGRSFIAAFDHGLTLGPKPGSESVLDGLQRIIAGGPDGILISPGTMKVGGHLFAIQGSPVPIVRADWIYNGEVYPGLPALLQDPRQGEHYEVICSPEDALAMGAGAITMFLIVGTAEGATFSSNARQVAASIQAARRVGIPVIVESVLWGSRIEGASGTMARRKLVGLSRVSIRPGAMPNVDRNLGTHGAYAACAEFALLNTTLTDGSTSFRNQTRASDSRRTRP
jgi:DhnA family fructose-bisphosphate aldolase class Ia